MGAFTALTTLKSEASSALVANLGLSVLPKSTVEALVVWLEVAVFTFFVIVEDISYVALPTSLRVCSAVQALIINTIDAHSIFEGLSVRA